MSAHITSGNLGFSPSEISTRVNRDIVARHAEEAAFLWTLRKRAINEPHYSLLDLAVLDERVEAHLSGLAVAGDVGWKLCLANLADAGPGEVFAQAILAFSSGDRKRMRDTLIVACTSPELATGLVSALGWLEYGNVSIWIERLVQAKSSIHREIGVAACAIHRKDPGRILVSSIEDSDSVLRARALRAAGEVKRLDLGDMVGAHLDDRDDACRFWAAWALTLLGGQEGVPVLCDFAKQNGPFAERALRLVLPAMDLADSRQLVRHLATQPQLARLAVLGVGVIGDPVSVPWLMEIMGTRELARPAGEAFTMITGLDLAYEDLNEDEPPMALKDSGIIGDDLVALDDDSNLPWPSASLLGQWWGKNRHSFPAGARYLSGSPISAPSMTEVLRGGKQRLRAAAALELALLKPDHMLFEVRARGSWQQRKLAAWT